MPTYEEKKKLNAINKTRRQKKEYNKIARELDSLKNLFPDYLLWTPDNKLNTNEKHQKNMLAKENQSTNTNYIRYIAEKINKLDKLVNRTY
jgi:hypothetical protein